MHYDGETEEQIKRLAGEGLKNNQIARKLGISSGTVSRVLNRNKTTPRAKDPAPAPIAPIKDDIDPILAERRRGTSLGDLAKIFKMSVGKIDAHLKRIEKQVAGTGAPSNEKPKQERSRPSPPIAAQGAPSEHLADAPPWLGAPHMLPENPTLADRYDYAMRLCDDAMRDYKENPSTGLATQIKLLRENASKLEAALAAERLRISEANRIECLVTCSIDGRNFTSSEKKRGNSTRS